MPIETIDVEPSGSLPEIYYDHNLKVFWIRDASDEFIQFTEPSTRRLLRSVGYSMKPREGGLSPLDTALLRVQREQNIAYAGPLAGWRKGMHRICGSRVLVTESPGLIEPVPGERPTLDTFLEGLLVDEVCDQRPFFYGWLKVAFTALHQQTTRPGQALVLAGPADSGKSLLQNLVTAMLGGRVEKPYQYLIGQTAFNGDLFRAEHLMIEDEVYSRDMRSRRHFGGQVKNLTVNETQRCHAKYRTALTLTPLWRLTVSLNDQPEDLLVLPPLDEGLEDKFIFLRANRRHLPMATATPEERKAFWTALMDDLPSFLHFLLNWQIPAELRSERFGVTHFHHPAVLSALDELSPELRLLTIIDRVLFRFETSVDELRTSENVEWELGEWEGLAVELEHCLTEKDAPLCHESRSLLSFYNACSTYLSRLAKRFPDRVSERRVHGKRLWKIRRSECERSTSESTSIA